MVINDHLNIWIWIKQHTCDYLEWIEQLASQQLSQGDRLVMRRVRSVEEAGDREEVCYEGDVVTLEATDLEEVTFTSDEHDLQGGSVTRETCMPEGIEEKRQRTLSLWKINVLTPPL